MGSGTGGFVVELTEKALDDLRFMKKYEQAFLVEAMERHLSQDPVTVARNRKLLRPNELAEWELRLGAFRVFYDVEVRARVVRVKAIGWKERNTLFIQGKEFPL